VAASVVFAAQFVTGPHQARAAAASASRARHLEISVVARRDPPSAREVAQDFLDVNNAHATAIGSAARFGKVSCLQGDPGSYVCSYVRTVPPSAGVCAVAMLKWTPDATSTYTVQTAGRVSLTPAACGPVTKVLHALGTS
jgi:hypothetical protein